jgi:hypothetical protein
MNAKKKSLKKVSQFLKNEIPFLILDDGLLPPIVYRFIKGSVLLKQLKESL